MLKIDALSNRRDDIGSTEFIQEFLKISLGEENAKKLIERNYKTKVYMKIMHCIEEVYSGISDEDEDLPSSEKGTELV